MDRRLTWRDEQVSLEAPAWVALPRVFGDGQHPTTMLAADELAAALAAHPGARVLDAGSGTGVLAERALAAGANEIVAVDRDADAVACTRVRIPSARVLRRDLTQGVCDLGSFDVIVTNLPTEQLVACAGALAAAVAPRGQLIATGAPLVFARRVERSIVCGGLTIVARRARSGWCALVAHTG